jgi:AAA ATPase-like protein
VDSNAPLPMGRGSRGPGRRTGLLGRASECALLDTLIGDIRRGESRSLVLRGEAGIGKTALLEYLVESVPDLNVVRAVGVESEMELAYASVHQLCAPLLDRLESLPAPQQDALGDRARLERRACAGSVPSRPRRAQPPGRSCRARSDPVRRR